MFNWIIFHVDQPFILREMEVKIGVTVRILFD